MKIINIVDLISSYYIYIYILFIIIKFEIKKPNNKQSQPYRIKQKMGNTQTSSSTFPLSPKAQSQLLSQISYIQSTNIPEIGIIQIFRFKQPPYDYIMKHNRTFSINDPYCQVYLDNLQQLTKVIVHKNLAQIHYYKALKQYQMCGRYTEIQIYANYYKITLLEVIEKRKKDDIRFTGNQIWYVLKSLLQISVLLRKNKYDFGNYRSKNITLSSQGYIKMYVLNQNKNTINQNQQQTHNLYYNALNNRIKISQYLPLPPQFLASIKQLNLTFPFQPEKEDSFMIATVIIEMMTDQDIRKYYTVNNQCFCVYKKNSVWKDIGMLGYVYDKKYLLPLLEKMLNEDPAKRILPQQALDFINQNRQNISIGGSLRMFQDQQNHIKPKVSYRTSFDFQSNILKTIQPNILEHKLTACPINTLSKRNNIKSIGVSLTSSKKSVQTKDKSLNKSKIFQNISSRGSSLSSKTTLLHH